MKFQKIFCILSVLMILTSCAKKAQNYGFLSEDVYASENFSNLNLNGHTINVTKNNITLANLYNGNVVITDEVGAGTVIIKNSSIENMIIESKASVILDEATSIKKLRIRGNAKITSTKTLENKYTKHKVKSVQSGSSLQPLISEVEIEYGCKPLFEGGNIENVTTLPKSEIVISTKSEAVIKQVEKSAEKEKLILVSDSEYQGNGTKIDIYNRPNEAEYMQIFKNSEGSYMQQIAWFDSNATWEPEQIERFKKDTFTYEYLDAGKEYTFIVNYLKKQGSGGNNFSIISSAEIKVVPKKGQAFTFDRENISLKIDTETSIAKWENCPKFNTKPGSIIQYSLNCGDWKYFGHRIRNAESSQAYSSFDIYKEIDYIDSKLYDGTKAYISVEYKYDGFVWNIYTSDNFDYDITKAKLPW